VGWFRGSVPQVTYYSGIQVQDTIASKPVPIVWGENMLTPNCIDYRNFNSQRKAPKGGVVGKLTGGASQNIYFADILLAICEGPIADVLEVYQTSYIAVTLVQCGLNLQAGDVGQEPTTYWEAIYPAYALGYSGIAYAYAGNFDLGPSASLGTISMVVQALRWGTGCNGVDADPALVILDFLTSTQYGVGFPIASINMASLIGASGTSSLQAYCQAAGLCFSPMLVDREAANSILERWLQLLNCTAVWSSGQLYFIPRGDQTITGNGWTWVPNLTIQYSLTDDSYYVPKGKSSSDPVQVVRSDPYGIDNYVSLDIVSRGDAYNSGPIPAFDQTAMDKYGPRIGSSISAREITDPAVAQVSAQLILQRGLYVRRTFQFKLSWEYGLLDPMDFVSITDTRIGLNATVVRIQSIEEDESGFLSIVAEEFVPGVATAPIYALQAPSNGTPNGQVTPNAVNAPIIFEPPPALSNGIEQLWFGISPIDGDPNWGGCNIWVSLDGGTSYPTQIGTIQASSTMGAIVGTLAGYSGANPDTVDTLTVDMSESNAALLSTTAGNAAGGATACRLGAEYLSYTTATLSGLTQYALTDLYRGLYGRPAVSHSGAGHFLFLNGPVFKYILPPSLIGQTLYFKFQSFSLFGTQLEALSACTAYSYTTTGEAQNPASFSYPFTSGTTLAAGSTTYEGPWSTGQAATITGFNVSASVAPGAGQSFTYTVYQNGSPTSLTGAISGASQTSLSQGGSVSVAASDTFQLQIVASASAAAAVHTGNVVGTV
jgi:hypothetical protein